MLELTVMLFENTLQKLSNWTHLIEMTRLDQQVNLSETAFMNLDQLTIEYSEGLTVLFNAVQGSVDEFKALEPWRADTHSLALKMFRHLESVKVLCQTYADMPPGRPPSYYIDFSSAQIVTRAAIETFLTFAYVFAQEDLTLSKFRSEMWRLSGLADRQQLHPGSSTDKLQLASENGIWSNFGSASKILHI